VQYPRLDCDSGIVLHMAGLGGVTHLGSCIGIATAVAVEQTT
jgi:hypothetical protein